jgi:hypothetical protein
MPRTDRPTNKRAQASRGRAVHIPIITEDDLDHEAVPADVVTRLVMSEVFNQLVIVDAATHPLKVFEDARCENADANTVDQVNRIVALATGLAAAAAKRPTARWRLKARS